MNQDTKTQSRDILRHHLNDLERDLITQYLYGQIYCEADIVVATIGFIKERVRHEQGFWMIGSEQYLPLGDGSSVRPDIVVYHSPGDGSFPVRFWENWQNHLVAFVEVKFANQGDDLEKLRMLQSHYGECLAWHVFGDHFDEHIHEENARKHRGIEAESMAWVKENAQLRGNSLLKFAKRPDWPLSSAQSIAFEYLRNTAWKRDRAANKLANRKEEGAEKNE